MGECVLYILQPTRCRPPEPCSLFHVVLLDPWQPRQCRVTRGAWLDISDLGLPAGGKMCHHILLTAPAWQSDDALTP